MYFLLKNGNKLLKIIGFLLISHTTLFADSIELKSAIEKTYSTESLSSSIVSEEVSLDTFGGISIGIVLVLTSILGAFFMRDELMSA